MLETGEKISQKNYGNPDNLLTARHGRDVGLSGEIERVLERGREEEVALGTLDVLHARIGDSGIGAQGAHVRPVIRVQVGVVRVIVSAALARHGLLLARALEVREKSVVKVVVLATVDGRPQLLAGLPLT